MTGPAIILIGFMGTGKSSVGAALARKTELPVFDTDAIIVAKFQTPITHVFERLGAEGFRDEETLALNTIPKVPGIVITGGGSVLRPQNVEVLKKLGRLAWLRASEETVYHRIAGRDDRPLLQGPDPRRRVAELMEKREEVYRRAADLVFETDDLSPDQIADLILEQLSPGRE